MASRSQDLLNRCEQLKLYKLLSHQLDHDQIIESLRYFTQEKISTGEKLVSIGQACTKLSFIEQGLFKLYQRDPNDPEKNIIHYFGEEATFITSFPNFLDHKPAEYDIEAVEDSVVLSIANTDMDMLHRKFPRWQALIINCLQQQLLKEIKINIVLRSLSAKDRYLAFLQMYPSLSNRVPLKSIASFLGVSNETISRIRNNLSKQRRKL